MRLAIMVAGLEVFATLGISGEMVVILTVVGVMVIVLVT